ncbi:ABC transporter ATPase [Paenibacillus sp. 32O-W]|uniref:ribosomal protection-like ABC-F family protein n=1 Tax=Paenibacillus sp. 32O-W TaxID=1695218 RepID=UPI000721CF3A|nr:ABC-F type ribosomal protection protein [Paenibacillus sp. 32O-W]ALS28303.1 ABC transporter ATPase [Paenibacillus sp. 32O-W]
MTVIAKQLRKEWNGETLFEQVSFEIREGERIALYGRNGTGKTTLLQALLGRIPLDGGTVSRLLPLEQWGSLDQHAAGQEEMPLAEFVLSGAGEPYRLKKRLEHLQAAMSGSDGLDETMEQYGQTYDRYLQLGGYDWEVKAEKALRQLRLDESLWHLPFGRLSGGQKTRAQLAALIVREPRFLVLDEPTNHLDAGTLEWLEEWVSGYPGTVLYVSHDRTFIDRTATAVIELVSGGCKRYAGGYTAFREQKELERRAQETLYKKQQQERDKLLESIRRYSEWFRHSHKAAGQNDFYRSKAKKNVSRLHAKEAALKRLDDNKVQKPRDPAQLHMQLESERFAPASLLRMEEVSFGYTVDRKLFDRLELEVNRGDRIALIGANGTGKTTLLKLLTGELQPLEGSVRLHPQASVGYFEQELRSLRMDETLLDRFLTVPDMTQTEARTLLGCFMFSRDDVYKPIRALSMGEKCRLAFLTLLLSKANLLVLDEPTNYLDIDTRERVEEALLHYDGALVLVTHDRYLVRRLANRLIVLDGVGRPRLFPGTYDEYAATDRSRTLSPAERDRENERSQLELELAVLMSRESPEDEEERQELMRNIRELRRRIAEMEDGKRSSNP